MIKTYELSINTNGNSDILDITNQVSKFAQSSGIINGIVTVFSPSSTSGITTIEFEDGCLKDLRRLFDEIISAERSYAHNARWGDGNGHSHVRAAILGASFTVPLVERKLTLGTWQQIIFVDFDNRARKRILLVQVMGE